MAVLTARPLPLPPAPPTPPAHDVHDIHREWQVAALDYDDCQRECLLAAVCVQIIDPRADAEDGEWPREDGPGDPRVRAAVLRPFIPSWFMGPTGPHPAACRSAGRARHVTALRRRASPR